MLNCVEVNIKVFRFFIQIQHLLMLNFHDLLPPYNRLYSNTTLVNVKFYSRAFLGPRQAIQIQHLLKLNEGVLNVNPLDINSNTTLVKVKFKTRRKFLALQLFKYNTC